MKRTAARFHLWMMARIRVMILPGTSERSGGLLFSSP